MKRILPGVVLLAAACGGGGGDAPPPSVTIPPPSEAPYWAQWGSNPAHTGGVSATGQALTQQLADIVYDPFVAQQMTESNGALLTHYQAPLVDGNDVYVMQKTGSYTPCSSPRAWATAGEHCGPNAWETMVWNEARYSWVDGVLHRAWIFASDWKPPPNGSALSGWEPVFHPLDANGFIYVPGAGGTLWKVNKATGTSAAHINPFEPGAVVAANTFTVSPLAADANGSIFYTVLELASNSNATADPWTQPLVSAWLVKVTSAGVASRVSFAALVPGAPAATDVTCPGQFSGSSTLPWPPSPTSFPADLLCGAQRPGVNATPAIAPDGTIYVVSRAHRVSMAGYLVAVNPDLTPKWAATLQQRFNDGCGVSIPRAAAGNTTTPNTCRDDALQGVDPRTNRPGSGVVTDLSTSSPVVLPDGSVLYGAQTNYNGRRGHLMHFAANGDYLKAYDFGWDITPAVWEHDGTWSIVLKDNHYPVGMYCSGSHPVCAPLPEGPYYLKQIDADFNIEWQFKSTNTQSCQAQPGGPPSCVSDHPDGFEWCINQPAIDANGTVYANSEDGRLYALAQGHSGEFTDDAGSIFLNLAIGAAYTPLAIGADGLLYTQNDGHLFVVGN